MSGRTVPGDQANLGTAPIAFGSIDGEGPPDLDARTVELLPIYRAAGSVLTWGFRVAAGLLTVGIAVALLRQEPLARRAEPLPEVISGLLDGEARRIVDLAIVAMIATPVMTTLAVAIGFLRLGDHLYAALSLVVLAILGTSIAVALLT
ncbi:MAG: DUF1634 domain-containing protein [Chloroflexota bacterium]|nr:DUF1634 domain-containing protein [Chloroflexota bacterium]